MQENRKKLNYTPIYTKISRMYNQAVRGIYFFNLKGLFAQEMNSACTCKCLNFYSRCRIRFSNDAGTLYNALEFKVFLFFKKRLADTFAEKKNYIFTPISQFDVTL